MNHTIRLTVAVAGLMLILATVQDHAAAPPLPVALRPTRVGTMAGESKDGGCVAFSPDGRTVVARHGADDQMVFWEVASLSRRLALTHPPARFGGPLTYDHFSFIGDGRYGVGTGSAGHVHVWDLRSGRLHRELRPPKGGVPSSLSVSPDGKLLAIGYSDSIDLWNLSKMENAGELRGDTRHVDALAFSPDGRTLASSNYAEATVQVWDVASRKVRATRGGPRRDEEGYLAFSPSGRLLAAGGSSEVRIWDAAGRPVAVWSGLPKWIRGLAFSPCGRWLAVGLDGSAPIVERFTPGEIRFWDVALGREVLRFTAIPSGLKSFAISPDGTYLAAGAPDGRVHLWRIQPPRISDAILRAGPPALPAGVEVPADVIPHWEGLAKRDGAEAYKAIIALSGSPRQALALLAKRLRPAPAVDRDRVRRLLRDLGADDFPPRERATRALAEMKELAEPALREAASASDLEAKRRAEQILSRLEVPIRDGDRLRAIRSVEVLEMIGTAEAIALLKWLATGAPEATLTRESRAAVERIRSRSGAKVP